MTLTMTFSMAHTTVLAMTYTTTTTTTNTQDSDKRWFESKIVMADEEKVKVHYMGWSERWDTVMKRTSTALQPFHSQVTPWRDLEKDAEVEISDSAYAKVQKVQWYPGIVVKVRYVAQCG